MKNEIPYKVLEQSEFIQDGNKSKLNIPFDSVIAFSKMSLIKRFTYIYEQAINNGKACLIFSSRNGLIFFKCTFVIKK